jgi:GTP-binding protein
VVKTWRTVRDEMHAYGGGLAEKPEIIGLNKSDAMTPRETSSRLAALRKASARPVYLLSGATGQGVAEVLRVMQDTIHATRREKAAPAEVA